MKYYSEKTAKLYETEADLVKDETCFMKAEAEKQAKEKAAKEKRAARAKAVEQAFKDANAAQTKANKLLKDFVQDYGSYHTSFSNIREDNTTIDDFIKQVFSFLGE